MHKNINQNTNTYIFEKYMTGSFLCFQVVSHAAAVSHIDLFSLDFPELPKENEMTQPKASEPEESNDRTSPSVNSSIHPSHVQGGNKSELNITHVQPGPEQTNNLPSGNTAGELWSYRLPEQGAFEGEYCIVGKKIEGGACHLCLSQWVPMNEGQT